MGKSYSFINWEIDSCIRETNVLAATKGLLKYMLIPHQFLQQHRKKRLSLATVVNKLHVIMGRVNFITVSASKILIRIVSSRLLLSGYSCSSFTQDCGQHSRLDISRSFSSILGFSKIYFSTSFTTIFFPALETFTSQQKLKPHWMIKRWNSERKFVGQEFTGQVVGWSWVMNLDIAKPETELDSAALGKGNHLLDVSLVAAWKSNITYLKEVCCHSTRTALPMFPAFLSPT